MAAPLALQFCAQTERLFASLPTETRQTLDTSVGARLSDLWQCHITALCAFRLCERGGLPEQLIKSAIEKFERALDTQQDLSHKIHSQLSLLVLLTILYLFYPERLTEEARASFGALAVEIRETVDMLEVLDELPFREHKLSLTHQMVHMLIANPLSTVASLPRPLAQLLLDTFGEALFPPKVGQLSATPQEPPK